MLRKRRKATLPVRKYALVLLYLFSLQSFRTPFAIIQLTMQRCQIDREFQILLLIKKKIQLLQEEGEKKKESEKWIKKKAEKGNWLGIKRSHTLPPIFLNLMSEKWEILIT